mmetsp:Transcript_36234/g.102099  ORF Transcript_36234/g.102099 Transcript_36234/m.102099 type:complete len:212 (-) Transcript_36234:650-1285(-)
MARPTPCTRLTTTCRVSTPSTEPTTTSRCSTSTATRRPVVWRTWPSCTTRTAWRVKNLSTLSPTCIRFPTWTTSSTSTCSCCTRPSARTSTTTRDRGRRRRANPWSGSCTRACRAARRHNWTKSSRGSTLMVLTISAPSSPRTGGRCTTTPTRYSLMIPLTFTVRTTGILSSRRAAANASPPSTSIAPKQWSTRDPSAWFPTPSIRTARRP